MPFTWDQVQQVIRIITYPISGYLMGKGWPEDMVMSLFGGAMMVGSVIWWYTWERNRTDNIEVTE